jgi:hypothetical protein
MNVSSRRGIAWVLLAFIGVSLGANVHADDADRVQRDVRGLANARCVIGLEDYVPAHYYYCLAIKSYGLQRYRDTHRFLLEASRWGSKQAEYLLGIMALDGDHQAIDKPLALAWFSLAAERHGEFYETAYQQLRASMSEKDIAASKALVQRLGPDFTDAMAADRAEDRYQQGMLKLHAMRKNDTICLSGMIDWNHVNGNASPDVARAAAAHCPTPRTLENIVNADAEDVFEGWGGHVTVGPLDSDVKARLARKPWSKS